MATEVTISLYNSNGIRLFADDIYSKAGSNEYKYSSVSDLSPGMYFLNIMQNGEVLASKKLLKQ